ncbi:hypothetical protein GCM10008949_44950 [Deinococcus humi]|nr:hypothetical protein GCM10008949_44950 [Deinococcus humi]
MVRMAVRHDEQVHVYGAITTDRFPQLLWNGRRVPLTLKVARVSTIDEDAGVTEPDEDAVTVFFTSHV